MNKISQRLAAVAVLSAVVTAFRAEVAAKGQTRAKENAKAAAVTAVSDPEILGDLISTLESADPGDYNQPVAVIATRSTSGVRILLETPPHNALGYASTPRRITVATYSGGSGSMAVNPNFFADESNGTDPNAPTAAGKACEQLAAEHKLMSSFVLVVQTQNCRDYSVVYAPIPYREPETQIVALHNIGKPGSHRTTPVAPSAPPAPSENTDAPDAANNF